MDVTPPLEIVHMSLGTGPDKTCGNDGATIEPSFFIESLAVNEPTGALSILCITVLLDDEPLRKAPSANSTRRGTGIVRIWRWGVQSGRGDSRDNLELTRQSGLDYLVQIRCLRPGIQSPDDC